MHGLAGPLRILARRILADPGVHDRHRVNQSVACTNAAEASLRLRKQRQDREEVDAYLHAHKQARLRAHGE